MRRTGLLMGMVAAGLLGAVAIGEEIRAGRWFVSGEFPDRTMLTSDVDGIHDMKGDEFVFTAYFPEMKTWAHVLRCASSDLAPEEQLSVIVDSPGMLFGRIINKQKFERSDGLRAGYCVRSMMGSGQFIGAACFENGVYKLMMTEDALSDEERLEKTGKKLLESLTIRASGAGEPSVAALTSLQTFRDTSSGIELRYPAGMSRSSAPYPGMVALFEGDPSEAFASLFVFDQTSLLAGTSPAQLLRDPESALYLLQQMVLQNVEQTEQGLGVKLITHPGSVTCKNGIVCYVLNMDLADGRDHQRFYFILTEEKLLNLTFSGGRGAVNEKLADQVVKSLRIKTNAE